MSIRRALPIGMMIFSLTALLACWTGCESKPPATQPAAEPVATAEKIGILPEGSPPPDVIVILVDALRSDRLGAYGNRDMLSPTMDRLSSEGVTFDWCMSQAPWTLPSVATLFTSYYPGVHKAMNYHVVEDMEQGKRAVQSVLSDDFTTLAEMMKSGGYQTAGFVGAKFLRAGYGFDQGFDHYDTSFAENTVRGDVLNAAFLKWFDEGRDKSKPMFAYLHYMDVHGPYNAAPRFMDPLMAEVEKKEDKQALTGDQLKMLNAYLRVPPPEATDPTQYERLRGYREYWEARYNAGVREMDFYLDQLIQNLKQRGVWNKAYVILIADHGEALCEHDLWEHGYTLYQTDLQVPMIMHWPNVLPAGKRVRRIAGLMDLMPTLAEQLHLTAPNGIQGVSLVDHISDRLPEKPLQLRFAEGIKAGPRQYALFTELTKLVLTYLPGQPQPDGTTSKPMVMQQLFNLGSDPQELFDVSNQYLDHVKWMGQIMRRIITENQSIQPAAIAPPKPVDQATINALSSLGYTGGDEGDEEPESQPMTQPAAEPSPEAPEPTP